MKILFIIVCSMLFTLNSNAESGCHISINETSKLNWEMTDTIGLMFGDSKVVVKLKAGQIYTGSLLVSESVSLNLFHTVLIDIDSTYHLRANVNLTTKGIVLKSWVENKKTRESDEIMSLIVEGPSSGVYTSYSSGGKFIFVSLCGFSG